MSPARLRRRITPLQGPLRNFWLLLAAPMSPDDNVDRADRQNSGARVGSATYDNQSENPAKQDQAESLGFIFSDLDFSKGYDGFE